MKRVQVIFFHNQKGGHVSHFLFKMNTEQSVSFLFFYKQEKECVVSFLFMIKTELATTFLNMFGVL